MTCGGRVAVGPPWGSASLIAEHFWCEAYQTGTQMGTQTIQSHKVLHHILMPCCNSRVGAIKLMVDGWSTVNTTDPQRCVFTMGFQAMSGVSPSSVLRTVPTFWKRRPPGPAKSGMGPSCSFVPTKARKQPRKKPSFSHPLEMSQKSLPLPRSHNRFRRSVGAFLPSLPQGHSSRHGLRTLSM